MIATPTFLPAFDNGCLNIYLDLLEVLSAKVIQQWSYLGVMVNFESLPATNRILITIQGIKFRLKELVGTILDQIVSFSNNISEFAFNLYKLYVSQDLSIIL